MQLHVAALLHVHALYSASGLVDADAGGVDGYGDGLSRLLEVLVWVDVEAEDAFTDAGVVDGWEVRYESVVLC